MLTFSRQDREQDLSGLSETMPPGLLGKIAGIPLCGEAQANAGTCGEESQIGTTSVTAGAGEDPLSITGGRVYLTTSYKGQPFGLSIVVPAVAGPFNLGNVVVRASIHIDPNTSQITVTSDPLPQSRDGVPFRVRTVNVTINRPGFTFNPTNCAQQQITGTITGAPVKGGEAAASASVSSPFAVTGCAGLPFKPSFSASTSGKTNKADGASLVVKVAQKPGEANIRKVDLTLPKILPARLTTLQKACTEAQFNGNPAGCPAASVIGTATAVTPVLNAPLTGPAYLVSHGGAAFPDIEFMLQGEGVQIVLDGKTDIKVGITYSKFETVPDAPIIEFRNDPARGSALGADRDRESVRYGHDEDGERQAARHGPCPRTRQARDQDGQENRNGARSVACDADHDHRAERCGAHAVHKDRRHGLRESKDGIDAGAEACRRAESLPDEVEGQAGWL